jgi:hypothetical protein
MDQRQERDRRRTLLVVNLASIMERADEALLPAVYQEVGAALHATPMGLGTLTLYRSAVQGACYPLAAYAAVRYNRAHVVAVGAVLCLRYLRPGPFPGDPTLSCYAPFFLS